MLSANLTLITPELSNKIYDLASKNKYIILEKQIELVLSGKIPADPAILELSSVALNLQIKQYYIY